jgi:2-polyprenyl-6-methoxyphenol hydroxylase-like FAD-dependent oxidoreductase
VLLGDAAHCMYPSLGLGISTAFADAVELSKQIEEMQVTKLSTEDALARYSANRSPNARLLQLVRYVLYFPNPPPCLPIQD